ncbi:hypothetical protein [Legionella cardiaca]|uniref:Transmembrane protein n=1 Tax=Legionella cardiaca TaxID=1071983 RepID=A0ABY8ASX2_9GAMM|nr:hypothetical protein [Legionella cardiaca]WED43773.1 hypothetical protein PXX05_03055 [Legionella cardiaca]
MYHFFRTFLIGVLWFSLLLAPYAFLSYLCYAGLCGGPVALEMRHHPSYIQIWTYYIWLYPLVVLGCLYASRQATKGSVSSLLILFIPIVCLFPLSYVLYQERKIKQQHEVQYGPQASDFVCAPGKFIRHDEGGFYFFDERAGAHGTAWVVSYFNNYDELASFIRNNELNILHCKNQSGDNIQSREL